MNAASSTRRDGASAPWNPLRPICEPVELPPGASLIAERVHHPADAAASAPFPHAHDVCEIVIFRRVAGRFLASGRQYPLRPGTIVYVPSMEAHDFALSHGEKDWILIQIDPIGVEALMLQPGLWRLASPFCVLPAPLLFERIVNLAEWLAELDAHDPAARPLLEALMTTIAGAPALDGEKTEKRAGSLDRLRPVLDRLRADPAGAPSAADAARLCHLSPSYFSRRFQRTLGLPYADYVRTHRLHLAARRLLASDATIAELAYSLGFSTPSHFTALFRQRFGVTPRAYRNTGR